MTPRGAILQIAKMVSQDMARGAPSRGALDAGPMLAQAGATPDLVACLVSEATRKRPSDRIVEACCFLLEGALTDLRIAGNGGDSAARAGLAAACQAVETAVTASHVPSKVLMLMARAFVQAGLARIIHQCWRTWCKPLIGHRIRLRDQNPADFGAHARQG